MLFKRQSWTSGQPLSQSTVCSRLNGLVDHSLAHAIQFLDLYTLHPLHWASYALINSYVHLL